MTIPAEFERFREPRKSEENFTQRYLKPLLQRLGYYSVRDYHGTREFGKDLVYAEVDKLAEISYHGLQAKFQDAITLTMAEDLALDAIQAFTNPFEHPTTHQLRRITTFLAVNAGTVSEQAQTHFFNKVGSLAGACRILPGKELLALDRYAILNRGQMIAETLDGLLLEANFNRSLVSLITCGIDQEPRSAHLNRFSDAACTNFLIRPLGGTAIDRDVVLQYAQQVRMANKCLDGLATPINVEPAMTGYVRSIHELTLQIYCNAESLIHQVSSVLAQLRPLVDQQ